MATTTAQAVSQWIGQGQRRPVRRNSATVNSIQTVRWAGTPQPLNSAYKAASATPPTRAACGAGTRNDNDRPSTSLRRQSQPMTKAASQANMVICSPEMLIRWATPVARKMSQSERSMAL